MQQLDAIRPATDAAAVHALLTECGVAMKERHGLDTWTPFRLPAAPALYVSAVGVRPSRQSRGLGRRCVEAAEALARARGCAAVRLDTAGENEPARQFFLHLGYEQRSPVLDRGRFIVVYLEEVL